MFELLLYSGMMFADAEDMVSTYRSNTEISQIVQCRLIETNKGICLSVNGTQTTEGTDLKIQLLQEKTNEHTYNHQKANQQGRNSA